MKRVLTKQEEQVIRLYHHDFAGYSIEDTAAKMGITVKDVETLLRSVKKKAPQMFPILNTRQQAILVLYDQTRPVWDATVKGKRGEKYHHLTWATIAASLNITLRMLHREVTFLRKHGFLFNRTMDQFDLSRHDDQIKEKF